MATPNRTTHEKDQPMEIQLEDPSLLRNRAHVHGEWIEASTGDRFDIIDPGTGRSVTSVPACGVDDIDKCVLSSQQAFEAYRDVNPRQRAKLLLAWHHLIEEAKGDIARIVVHETGKPLAEAIGEVDYALGFTWWFAGEAERVRGSTAIPSAPNRRTFVVKQPIGVAVALVPWNFPVAMVLRKAAAALAAGCTMIIKPSPETPLSVLALVELAARAGFGKGVLNVLTTDMRRTPEISEALCKHPLVRKVTFTGSTNIGRLVAKHCSHGLKKLTLELGGNCPFLVFDDGDLQKALEALMILKWRTAGQACTHANRVYVQRGVAAKFEKMLLAAVEKIKTGHGLDPSTTMGALTTSRGIEKLESHITDAVAKGAALKAGGRRPKGLDKGNFFEPTVLSDMKSTMLASREEIFGPLLCLYVFDTEEEAITLANNTNMGLASYFFTRDVNRTWRLLESLDAGMIGMNSGNSSCAESAFGGLKESGYGKEAGKDVAIEEYLVAKTGTLTLEDPSS